MLTASARPVSSDWVLAAPFRAHVRHLIGATGLPWPAIACQAGVPLSAIRTLLYGRNGRERPKISPEVAESLMSLTPRSLHWLNSSVASHKTGERIRAMRAHNISWSEITERLLLDEGTCQAIARGERTSCPAMTDALAQRACLDLGLGNSDA